MRPGQASDLTRIHVLWMADARAGRRDSAPGAGTRVALAARFDWAAKSRVAEDGRGGLEGAVLVMSRPSPGGVLATVDVAGAGAIRHEMAQWGLAFSRAAGAAVVQVFAGPGASDGLVELGFQRVRPWWRMDRSVVGSLPEPKTQPGYQLVDGRIAPAGSWSAMHNRAFADHWRFSPRSEEEVANLKDPALCLMAMTARDHEPSAIAICHVETYSGDPRPQPVGLVGSVGTLSSHRRRGLATWLVAEGLHRLQARGAETASLYVDGWNQTGAHEAYRKLGFELAFESQVWEATRDVGRPA